MAKMDTGDSSGIRSLTKGLIIAASIIVAISFVFFLLTKGNTTTTTQQKEQVVASSLHCTASDAPNEVFNTLGASPVSYTIDAIFYNDKLDSITNIYKGSYVGKDIKSEIEPYIHGNIDKYLYRHETTPDNALRSVNYDIFDDQLQISISANGSQINNITAPIFLLSIPENGNIPTALGEYKTAYTNNSFICTEKKG